MISMNDAFKSRLRMALIGSIAAAIAIAASPAASRAQEAPPADTYAVNYYSFNVPQVPSAAVRIINPTSLPKCAYLYVFDASQNLQTCCSCPITSNGLLTLSVRQLTTNPSGAAAPVTGVIKLVSSSLPAGTTAPAGCNISSAPIPTPALRAWATHVQISLPPQRIQLTEDEFLDSPLDETELETNLTGKCSAGIANKSVYVCGCGPTSTGG